ncbi:hypothetical protein GC174_18215 [bacterium]|nr:hypothetical protein [bacterium]
MGVVSITSVRVPEPPFLFDANRPFAFALFDNSTGAIAFFGTVSEF